MSFTGGLADGDDCLEAFVGCTRCEMVGNGRRARDEGNDGLRLGTMRWVAEPFDCECPARGEETAGRDIVRVAIAQAKKSQR